jgi:hypothetical protein
MDTTAATPPPPSAGGEYAQQTDENGKQIGKYKTKLCVFNASPQGCPYGDECLFAHGTFSALHCLSALATKTLPGYPSGLMPKAIHCTDGCYFFDWSCHPQGAPFLSPVALKRSRTAKLVACASIVKAPFQSPSAYQMMNLP